MAPRRRRSIPNVHAQKAQAPPQRVITPTVTPQRQHDLLLAIYQSNMKVLLRQEPAITSIIDQFSHVCIYYHTGEKWERYGYEGSMFLFEKSTYPTYGFFILNRQGAEDFVRPIYPEDDMEVMGNYLMVRFYSDYTATRLAMGLPHPIPEESRDAFKKELALRVPPGYRDSVFEKEKGGRGITLGLWMFATDAREPLKDVMMRLYSYIKQGLPYPEEFRFPHGKANVLDPLRTASRASVLPPHGQTVRPVQHNVVNSAPTKPSEPPTAPSPDGNSSELDKLFAKLMPSTSLAPTPAPQQPAMATQEKSVNDLFAALTRGSTFAHHNTASSPSTHQIAESPPSRGPALLDSIFASAMLPASSSAAFAPPQPALPSRPEEIVIVSPKPTSSALPQILNQDVISSLLGLSPHSRASSAAPSSASSHHSGHRRYEGDNEYSEEDQASEEDVPGPTRFGANGKYATKSAPGRLVPYKPYTNGHDHGRIQGDVTPRAPPGGAHLPSTSPSESQQRSMTPTANGRSSAAPVIPAAPATSADARARSLVPFEANSDLWPYPRAPLDDRSFEQDDVPPQGKKEKKGRKSRKEREQLRKEQEKAEIEKAAAATVSSPGPKTAVMDPQQVKVVANETNGHAHEVAFDKDAAKQALLAAMFAKPVAPNLGRREFVQEVLDAIYKDPAFVDGLWQDYLSRTT
ncbi:uncharacterized protein BXZ73DRAFT_98498 [Epithele typhae]|uniref:uncharacterized protein n=1 Tax=Epithele typhae TaxID=378194 RepID=UPI0020077BB8|nr:uncharacterized protein BXZ73DRAFT_98498 [Epithele typhae]KAH9941281.1 hypothetical protein BXZ73DRAFT_98498 [Epithele typhae]